MSLKARGAARRARRAQERAAEIAKHVAAERSRGQQVLRSTLERRPFRVPMPGEEAEGVLRRFLNADSAPVTRFLPEPTHSEVFVPISRPIDRLYATYPRVPRPDLALFITRPWRCKYPGGEVVEWYQWSPKNGPKEYPAVASTRRLLQSVDAIVGQIADLTGGWASSALGEARTRLRFALDSFDAWVGSEVER